MIKHLIHIWSCLLHMEKSIFMFMLRTGLKQDFSERNWSDYVLLSLTSHLKTNIRLFISDHCCHEYCVTILQFVCFAYSVFGSSECRCVPLWAGESIWPCYLRNSFKAWRHYFLKCMAANLTLSVFVFDSWKLDISGEKLRSASSSVMWHSFCP